MNTHIYTFHTIRHISRRMCAWAFFVRQAGIHIYTYIYLCRSRCIDISMNIWTHTYMLNTIRRISRQVNPNRRLICQIVNPRSIVISMNIWIHTYIRGIQFDILVDACVPGLSLHDRLVYTYTYIYIYLCRSRCIDISMNIWTHTYMLNTIRRISRQVNPNRRLICQIVNPRSIDISMNIWIHTYIRWIQFDVLVDRLTLTVD